MAINQNSFRYLYYFFLLNFVCIVSAKGQSINASAATGTITACFGKASANPNLQQFIVSGSAMTAPIIATAPPDFEISTNPISGYSNTFTLSPIGSSVSNTLVYVRSKATAPVGKLLNQVVFTSTGATTKNVTVTGIVNALPALGAIANYSFTAGGATSPINFTGTGGTLLYNWTNNNASIGLPASGMGSISSFTAINNGSSPVVATISASPVSVGLAYVANYNSNSVSVINTITHAVVTTIPVGSNPGGVSVSPDGSRVYVTNDASDDVSVINTNTHTVMATIAVGSGPFGIMVSPDGSRVYVANYYANSISVINTATLTIVATIPINSSPYGIAVSPDGNRVYVSTGADKISVVNTSTHSVVATIPVGSVPRGISVSPDGSRVYVANNGIFANANTVSVINTSTNAVIATVPVGKNPYGIAISPDGSKIYVANHNSSDISVIDAYSHTVDETVALTPGLYPQGISVSPEGNKLYVANYNGNGPDNISVINTSTSSLINTIEVGTLPLSLGNFVTAGTGCSGEPVLFTITVTPAPPPPILLVKAAMGVIHSCAGAASDMKNGQEFTVSGTNLTAPLTLTTQADFEISTTVNSGYSKTLSLSPAGSTVPNTVVYVRLSTQAPIGSISEKLVIATIGATSLNVSLTGQVNALPTVDAITNQVVDGLTATNAINFTGNSNVFNWTNSNPSIGLPASGTGSIPSFTAINNSSSPVVASLTVTPMEVGFAYVANYNSNNISVINTSTNAVVATIPVGSSPTGVLAHPDGSRVYIIHANSPYISVIQTKTNAVIARIMTGSSANGVCVSPDGSRLYVTYEFSNMVLVINTLTNVVESTIAAVIRPKGISISPDGSRVYVTNFNSNTVSVINTKTNAVEAQVTVGSGPQGIATHPDGSRVYVTNYYSGTVSVVNANTLTVVNTIDVGTSFGIVVSPDGSRVYVANGNANKVSVINTATNTLLDKVSVGSYPQGLSISPDGNYVYAMNNISNSVSLIKTSNNTVTETILVGSRPSSMGMLASGGIGCSGNPGTFTITVNPTPPSIIAGTVGGTITACVGTASQAPNVQQFTVSAVNLTTPLTVLAPTGFKISTSSNSNYSHTLSLDAVSGSVANTVIYICSADDALAGTIAGNVVLSSTGAVQKQVAVMGKVTALPTMDATANQIVDGLKVTAPIQFSGNSNVFKWTNSNPSIGLPASGTGSIPSFTAINNSSSPVVATITATPAAAAFAYIPTSNGNYVWVINASTNRAVDKLLVGENPQGVSVSPDGSRVYVTNLNSNTVSVIYTRTNSVISTVSVGEGPMGVAVSPDGKNVYVGNSAANTVSVLDMGTQAIIATIPVGIRPQGLSFSPDGSRVYIANAGSNTVSVINTLTQAVVATIPGGNYSTVVSPNGSLLYVPNFGSGEVSVINTSTNMEVAKIPVGMGPYGISITPDGSRVYVSNHISNNVSVINTSTNAVIATVSVGRNPSGVSVSPDGNQVYVVNTYTFGTVSVINTRTNLITETIWVDSYPISLGNFFTNSASCDGTPATFTITVNPAPPNITASAVTGSISACSGQVSVSPRVQQFTISGNNLSSLLTATAPAGFEVSGSLGSGYGNTVSYSPSNGVIANIPVYVRSAATAVVGDITGDVVLTSLGAPARNIAVKGTIQALPSLATSALAGGVVGLSYTATITNNPSGYTYSAIGLPSGLVITTAGVITGTPTVATTSPAKVTVTANGLCPQSTDYSLTINRGTAIASITNSTRTYDGGDKSATVTTTPLGLAVDVTYDGSTNVPSNVGSYTVVATITDANYSGTASSTLTITKARPTLTIVNQKQTFDGSPKPVTITTTPAGLAYGVRYDGGSTVPTFPGTYTVTAMVNTENYEGSVSGLLTIEKAAVQVAFINTAQTYDGNAKKVTVLTQPTGLISTVTYNGSSTLPISAGTYAVVATIIDSNYVGTTSGNLTINKATAILSFTQQFRTYDGTAKPVSVTTTPAGLAYHVTYDGSPVAPSNAGVYSVVATITDANYAGMLSSTWEINKASLIIKADDKNKDFSRINPALTLSYTGFIEGETENMIDLLPTVNTAATQSSEVGTYAITLSGGNDNNYTLVLQNGWLTINKSPQAISFQPIPDKLATDLPFALLASATSNLPVIFNVLSGPAIISGNLLTISGSGQVRVQAIQAGNENYHSATAEQDFKVSIVMGIEPFEVTDIQIYPNPAADKLTLVLPSHFKGAELVLMDVTGHIVLREKSHKVDLSELSIAYLPRGLYILRITNNQTVFTKRVVFQ